MPVQTNDYTVEEAGYGVSTTAEVAIASGGTLSDVIDFGRPHFVFVIRIPDCAEIAAATSMQLLTATYPGTTMCDMYETNDPSIQWSKGALPVAGSLSVLITHAFGARFMQIEFTVVTTGVVNIEVIALDPAVGDVPQL